MTNIAKTVATAALSLAALTACSVNTAPPERAAAPSPVVVAPSPAPAVPGNTVIVPRAY